jgi:hypothetical protein
MAAGRSSSQCWSDRRIIYLHSHSSHSLHSAHSSHSSQSSMIRLLEIP